MEWMQNGGRCVKWIVLSRRGELFVMTVSFNRKFRLFLVFSLSLVINSSLFSHDLWIQKEGQLWVLYYGHLFGQRDGSSVMEYDPESVRRILCRNGSAVESAVPVRSGSRVASQESCDTIIFFMEGGYYTKTPHGVVRKPKSELSYPIKSWISHESVKRIVSEKSSRTPVGQGLEITPLKEVTRARPGDKIPFLVTENGSPVQGLPVSINGKVRGSTDSSGRINLRLRKSGDQIVQTAKTVPLHRSDADEEIFSSTLHFVTEDHP